MLFYDRFPRSDCNILKAAVYRYRFCLAKIYHYQTLSVFFHFIIEVIFTLWKTTFISKCHFANDISCCKRYISFYCRDNNSIFRLSCDNAWSTYAFKLICMIKKVNVRIIRPLFFTLTLFSNISTLY